MDIRQKARFNQDKSMRIKHMAFAVKSVDNALLNFQSFLSVSSKTEKVIWENTDKELLCSITKSYLKTWTQNNWGDEFNWGTLPIRRHKRLSFCVKWNKFFIKI